MDVLAQLLAGIFNVACHGALRNLAVLLAYVAVPGCADEEGAAVPVVEIQQKIAEVEKQRLATA